MRGGLSSSCSSSTGFSCRWSELAAETTAEINRIHKFSSEILPPSPLPPPASPASLHCAPVDPVGVFLYRDVIHGFELHVDGFFVFVFNAPGPVDPRGFSPVFFSHV